MAQITPLDELEATERELGADDEELAEILASVKANHERGYYFGNWYSPAEPKGELGDTHASQLVAKLTPEQFEQGLAALRERRYVPWLFELAKTLSE